MENSVSSSTPTPKGSRVNLSFDVRWIIVVLLVVIGIMVALWRPWQARISSTGRTISVTGEATVKSTPDEYVFTPSYEFKDADKTVALKDLTDKQDAVVAGLKKLGVKDAQIKADSNGYNQSYYYDDTAKTYDYTLTMQVTVNDKALTQKVQDYLVSTSPTGSVSPAAQFSEAKQKQLESQGRDEATKDARKKADQSANNLGFKVGAVKSVDDSNGGGVGGCGAYGLCSGVATPMATSATDSATKSLTVQSGENELTYSVTVVYYVK